jgi:hypothetical protein
MPPTLQSVTAVLHRQPAADALDQAAPLITQFLGPPPNLSLSQACRFQSTALLDWIWGASCASEASRGPDWTLGNFLRSDEFYHRWQFGQAVKVAVELGSFSILEWLFGHFKGAIVDLDVVIKAAKQGKMSMLRFMLENDPKERGNTVQWGAGSVQQALRANQLDVARWLYENTPQDGTTEEQHTWTIKAAMEAGAMEFCESLLPKGRCLLDYADFCNIPEMIEWKLDCGYFKRDTDGAVVAIRDLALENRLDEMKRIAELHNPPPEDLNWVGEWREAVEEACSGAKLGVVKWLMEHPTGRLVVDEKVRGRTFSRLLHSPAEKGDVDTMQFLHGQGAVHRLGNALIKAVSHDQMESVQWLLERFPPTEKIPDYCLMDEAARHGCMDLLQLFQSLGPSSVPGFFPVAAPAPQPDANGDVQEQIPIPPMEVEHAGPNRKLAKVYRYRSVWAATDPMDDAAANGELEAVQWLHLYRTEGCTTAAMDSAAANGHLDVVKWLHANRSEGCTGSAMEFAAGNGHLEIVQWLHVNSPMTCTTDAMDLAADGGHLATLKWLRANRDEGCTAMALEGAIGNDHLDVACWIQQNYPDLAPTKVRVPSPLSAFNVLLLLHEHYPNLLADDLVEDVQARLAPRFKRPNDVHVVDWLKKNHPLPELPANPRGRFDGLAERMMENIAGQIAGQLGGVVHVLPAQGVADRADGLAMNNFMVVVQRGEDGDGDEDM